MRRIWEPCSFVGQKGVCTVRFPTFYIFMYPHIQIAVSVDALRCEESGEGRVLPHRRARLYSVPRRPVQQRSPQAM